jgi:hypothetical protein
MVQDKISFLELNRAVQSHPVPPEANYENPEIEKDLKTLF